MHMTEKRSDYPYEETRATQMLATALKRAWNEKRLSQRTLAKQLGYRSSVVLSHMASGRVPIPIERVDDYAQLLDIDRSEEHTSELQSLMRISYAVFCLK